MTVFWLKLYMYIYICNRILVKISRTSSDRLKQKKSWIKIINSKSKTRQAIHK